MQQRSLVDAVQFITILIFYYSPASAVNQMWRERKIKLQTECAGATKNCIMFISSLGQSLAGPHIRNRFGMSDSSNSTQCGRFSWWFSSLKQPIAVSLLAKTSQRFISYSLSDQCENLNTLQDTFLANCRCILLSLSGGSNWRYAHFWSWGHIRRWMIV